MARIERFEKSCIGLSDFLFFAFIKVLIERWV